MSNTKLRHNLALTAYAVASVVAVLIAYDFFGFMPDTYLVAIVLVVGLASGWRAMKLSTFIPLKVLLGIPVALNSIVALYFSGSAVLYFLG